MVAEVVVGVSPVELSIHFSNQPLLVTSVIVSLGAQFIFGAVISCVKVLVQVNVLSFHKIALMLFVSVLAIVLYISS